MNKTTKDVENGLEETQPLLSFDDASICNGFVRKVYGLVCLQLLVILAFMEAFQLVPALVSLGQDNLWTLGLALGIMLVTVLLIACSEAARKSFPFNFLVLGIFTATQGWLIGKALFSVS
jgi:FtsH-binding integral membrane protein